MIFLLKLTINKHNTFVCLALYFPTFLMSTHYLFLEEEKTVVNKILIIIQKNQVIIKQIKFSLIKNKYYCLDAVLGFKELTTNKN